MAERYDIYLGAANTYAGEDDRRQMVRRAHDARLPLLKARARRSGTVADRRAYIEELLKEEGDGTLPDPAFLE